MAATGTITIQGTIEGLATGTKVIDLAFDIAAAIDQSTLVSLASGDNTFAWPTGANAVLIIPPTSNTTITLKAKGAGADTGITLAKAAPSLISHDASAGNVVINASGILAGVTVAFV